MNISYWEAHSFYGNKDLVVVGCGIVGLMTAINYRLNRKKADVLIIDRGAIPDGASTKNAGFACIGSSGELLADLKTMSEDEVFNLVNRRKKGLQKLIDLLGEKRISYQHYGGYELFDEEEKFQYCQQGLGYLNQKLFPITGLKDTFTCADKEMQKFGFSGVSHLIKNHAEGQLNSGKMMSRLMLRAQKLGISFLFGSKVMDIEDGAVRVQTLAEGPIEIMSDKILVSTNGFAQQLLPQLDVQPARAQVLVTSPIKDLKVRGSFHYDEGYYYFRNIDNRILLGGGRNLDFMGEHTFAFGNTPLIMNKLEQMLREKIIPGLDFKIERQWSGIMGVGTSKCPIIKKIRPGIYCAVRMGGMGIAIGSLVGEEAAKMLLDDEG